MSSEVSTRASSVPALAYAGPSLDEFDASDIITPRLYVGQALSAAVQEGLAKLGDVYSGNGAEDPDAEVLFNVKDGGEGVLFHVIGLDKGKAYRDQSTEFTAWSFNDPSAHPDAWTTYHFTLALPEVDPEMPYKITLARSNQRTARNLITALKRAAAAGTPVSNLAFRLSSKVTENNKGKFGVFVVKAAEATSDGIEVANYLGGIVNSQVNVPAADEGPSI